MQQPHSIPSTSDVVVMAADEASLDFGQSLGRRRGTQWPTLMVNHLGDALRYVVLRRPRVALVCVTTGGLEFTAGLIAALRRARHGATALVTAALAAEHDEAVERASRAAGATYYLALDCRADDRLLDELLRVAGLPPPDTVGEPPEAPPPFVVPRVEAAHDTPPRRARIRPRRGRLRPVADEPVRKR